MAHNDVPLSVVDLGVLRDVLDREWTDTRPGRRKARLLRLAAMFAVFAEADDKAEIAVTIHRAAKLTALDRRGPGCIPMIIGGYVG
jgi:hypothetical protein